MKLKKGKLIIFLLVAVLAVAIYVFYSYKVREKRYDRYFNPALLSFVVGEYKDALSLAREAYKLKRTSKLYNLIASCYLELEEYDLASDWIDKGRKEFGEHERFICTEGLILLDRGELDKAENIFKDLYKKNPQDPSINEYLGILYTKKEDFENAEWYLNNALKTAMNLRKGERDELSLEITDNLLVCKLAQEKYNEVIMICRNTFKKEPNFYRGYIHIAEAYSGRGDRVRSEKSWKKVLEKYEDFPEGIKSFAYAKAYAGLGDYEKSLEYWNTMLKIYGKKSKDGQIALEGIKKLKQQEKHEQQTPK